MHFIEQVFGFSPDGGSGLTELLILLIPLAGLLLAAIVRYKDPARDDSSTSSGRGDHV
jgi:hypothetical protein